jgi:hypothetical protein
MSKNEWMKFLADEKVKVLAEKNGWTAPRAKGFLDGEGARRRGQAPSRYAQVGIDDYSLGFRAGYYVRQTQRSAPTQPAAPRGKAGGDL